MVPLMIGTIIFNKHFLSSLINLSEIAYIDNNIDAISIKKHAMSSDSPELNNHNHKYYCFNNCITHANAVNIGGLDNWRI